MAESGLTRDRTVACACLMHALAVASIVGGVACAPITRSQGSNAAAVQFMSGNGGPECDEPQGVNYDPAQVCAPQVELDAAPGIAASYARRLWGLTRKEGLNLRLGPELVGGWISNRRLAAPEAGYPTHVSEWFTAALVRVDAYNEGSSSGTGGKVVNRLHLNAGGGLSVVGFRESDVLADGSANANRRSDVVVGPVVNFGLGYWITSDLVLRGDLYGAFLEPQLSFPWERPAGFVGIGLVKIF